MSERIVFDERIQAEISEAEALSLLCESSEWNEEAIQCLRFHDHSDNKNLAV